MDKDTNCSLPLPSPLSWTMGSGDRGQAAGTCFSLGPITTVGGTFYNQDPLLAPQCLLLCRFW
jgi:hypothetical protein